jgi:hypothetical protein
VSNAFNRLSRLTWVRSIALAVVIAAGVLLYNPVMNAVFVDRDGIGTDLPTTSPKAGAATASVDLDVSPSMALEPAEPQPVAPAIPPDAFINGVAGDLITFCWTNGCADGVVTDPTTLPEVTGPFVVTLPEGAQIAGVTAWGPGAPNPEAVEVPHTSTTFGRVPDNTMMLSIFVYFEQGGDAAYYWALGDLP